MNSRLDSLAQARVAAALREAEPGAPAAATAPQLLRALARRLP